MLVPVSNFQAAGGNYSKTPPGGVTRFKNLIHHFQSLLVTIGTYTSSIGDFYLCCALFNLGYQHFNRLKNIKRLEPGDDARDTIFTSDKFPGMRTYNGTDMPRTDRSVQSDVARTQEGLYHRWADFMLRKN